jgi:hypothetical protein
MLTQKLPNDWTIRRSVSQPEAADNE